MAKAQKGLTKHLHDQALEVQLRQSGHAYMDKGQEVDSPFRLSLMVLTDRMLVLQATNMFYFSQEAAASPSFLLPYWSCRGYGSKTARERRRCTSSGRCEMHSRSLGLVSTSSQWLSSPRRDALRVSIYVSGKDAEAQDLDLPPSWDVQWGMHPDAAFAVSQLAENASSPSSHRVDLEKRQSSTIKHPRRRRQQPSWFVDLLAWFRMLRTLLRAYKPISYVATSLAFTISLLLQKALVFEPITSCNCYTANKP